MTSGGGPEIPKSRYLKKQCCEIYGFQRGDNFKFMYCFISTPGDFG